MIDFHNHVLPNIDDGSKSLEMSLNMLRFASEQGITDVVNTVHYKHPKVEYRNLNYSFIHGEIKKLQNELDKNQISIKLHLASEVFFNPTIESLIDDPLAVFSVKKFMLIEFQPHIIPDFQTELLFNLKMAGVNPIIAHPERYLSVQNEINTVFDWLNLGCLIQIDAGSVLGTFGKGTKKCSERIIKNGWAQILGSDAHNDKKRNFCLAEAYNTIFKWIGKDAHKLVFDNPKALIEGKHIQMEYEEEARKTSILKNLFFNWVR